MIENLTTGRKVGKGLRIVIESFLGLARKQSSCRDPSLQELCLVEMAGIEPASREFDPGYPTSLVGLLLFARASPNRRGLTRTSRSKLG